MGEITKDEIRERMGNIDLIRDIIFGSKLQEYDNRIDKLESNLSLLEKDTRDRLEQVKSECLTELRESVAALEEKINSLSITAQKDNADLRQMVNGTYKSFSSSLESIDKTVVTQTTSIRKELSETKEKLQEDTRNLKAQIFDELERRFSMLSEVKVSRNDMADIMFEVGLKLKKTDLAPELKEAMRSRLDDVLVIEA
ncbi:MAG TPA: hypothetical protein DCE56_25385, partial [Cyanobacteria bacterium UBA8553]|nr:hypothetical protein [Cyanobacteria bacterium UBA8553]